MSSKFFEVSDIDVKLHVVFQSEKIVEIEDGYDDTRRNAANNAVLSEEVSGTPDDAECQSESHGKDAAVDNEEDDDVYEHPGEASIGKKLWNFLTT